MARKTPSFNGLSPASHASSLAKRRNKRRDTAHELILRRELWRSGLRFRKNVETMPGKPDIVFPSAKIAVFCDGDFWHGRNWASLKKKLAQGSNASYWHAKIASNIKRDRSNIATLKRDGWMVIRIWESDIRRDAFAVAARIRQTVHSANHAHRNGKNGSVPGQTLRFVDLFAGLGGFHIALARLGHDCVFASELSSNLRKLYSRNFGIDAVGDIREIRARGVPPHDILCAVFLVRFPC